MKNDTLSFFRLLAATLMCLTASAQIIALWLQDLSGTVLSSGLLGSLYLVVGIGLFGRSQLALIAAIITVGLTLIFILYQQPHPIQPYRLHMAIDAVVACCCLLELWRVRHNGSV